MAMTEAAREARNAYKREWNKRNREKIRLYNERYWQKQSDSERQKTAENGRNEGVKHDDD